MQHIRIFKQWYHHLSQLELHKQNCSDIPIKSNQGSVNQEIAVAKGLVHHIQSIASQKWHLSNCNSISLSFHILFSVFVPHHVTCAIHSYTINNCYIVLYQPLKFIPWVMDYALYISRNNFNLEYEKTVFFYNLKHFNS